MYILSFVNAIFVTPDSSSKFNKYVSTVKNEHTNETINSVVIKNNIKNISSKNFNLEIGFSERLFRLCYKKNEKSKIYERLTAKMLKFTSIENLLKLTKNNKILKSVVFNETLRYISNICLYPQKISNTAKNPDNQGRSQVFLRGRKIY